MKENIFSILDIISSKQVASRGRGEIPSCCFKAKDVDTKFETSRTANDISRKVKGHVSGKPIRKMSDQSSLCRQCAPLVISTRFAVAVALGWPSD